jgi:hypothetical protein
VWRATLQRLQEAGLSCDEDVPRTGLLGARITRHVKTMMAAAGLAFPVAEGDEQVCIPLKSHFRQVATKQVSTLAAATGLSLPLADYDAYRKLFDARSGKLRSPDAARPLICIGVLALLWTLRNAHQLTEALQGSVVETPVGPSLH